MPFIQLHFPLPSAPPTLPPFREPFNVEALLPVWTYNSKNVELRSLHVAGLSFVPTGYTLFSYKFWTLVVVSIFVAGPQCHSEPLTFNHHS